VDAAVQIFARIYAATIDALLCIGKYCVLRYVTDVGSKLAQDETELYAHLETLSEPF
jgi:hypothetical protein